MITVCSTATGLTDEIINVLIVIMSIREQKSLLILYLCFMSMKLT